ncbi:MAG: hypothetical protein RLZZ297_1508 [Chloroflexota bacterium]|jgi:PPOX class probable F420-dependent enzyme
MSFSSLTPEQFVNLATTKKSGQVITTPVWFVLDGDGATMYVMTGKDAGKIKRIRHTAAVTVGACDRTGNPLGPTHTGTARILDESEHAHVNALLNTKYGFMKRMFDFMAMFNGGTANRAFIAITPNA